MTALNTDTTRAALETLYRAESRRVLATLIRLLGDFELAEEALQEAFRAALEQWPRDGLPDNPRVWLVSTGRFKAIDTLRRRGKSEALYHADEVPASADADPATRDEEGIADDRLRLVFTCCHPALAPDTRIALTLREVCDLTTEEIARAFLTPTTTIALFGLRQVWLQLIGKPYTSLKFVTPGPYRLVRHPLYVGWLFVFWATPTMTVTHLFFALVTTAYILIAIQFEERDLITFHGDDYRNYRKHVPMLIPRLARNRAPVLEARQGGKA